MRFSTRSKLGIILSLFTILTVASGFMVMAIASRGSGAHAVSSTGVSYHTASGNLANQPVQPGGQDPAHALSQTVYAPPSHFGKTTSNTSKAAAQNAPGADSLSLLNGRPTLLHRSEEHTSELQSLRHLVCRLLLEKKKKLIYRHTHSNKEDS